MNDIMHNLTGIALAVIGLAMLTVTVKNGQNTSQVISASSQGFSQVLTSAMGSNSYVGG